MQLEPQVTFKNVNPSDLILDQIQERLGRLEQRFAAIRSCRVVFERPQPASRKVDRFRVDLVLALTGGFEVAVSRDAPDAGPDDPAAAVREAFEAAERRVELLLSRRRQAVRTAHSVIAEWEAP